MPQMLLVVTFRAFTYILPQSINFKSPGALNENLAGSWNIGLVNSIGSQFSGSQPISGQISQPLFGLFGWPIVYDNDRQALYAMYQAQSPNNFQNMRIYFIISRDNGQTWSKPIDISNTDFANRGFPTMALDAVTGDLVFGWYDGRNTDPNSRLLIKSRIFCCNIACQDLTKLVNAIPHTMPPNPTFMLPSAAVFPA